MTILQSSSPPGTGSCRDAGHSSAKRLGLLPARPLTDEEREWAGRPENVAIARRIGRHFRDKYPRLGDSAESASFLGLIQAARAFGGKAVREDNPGGLIFWFAKRRVFQELAAARPLGYRGRYREEDAPIRIEPLFEENTGRTESSDPDPDPEMEGRISRLLAPLSDRQRSIAWIVVETPFSNPWPVIAASCGVGMATAYSEWMEALAKLRRLDRKARLGKMAAPARKSGPIAKAARNALPGDGADVIRGTRYIAPAVTGKGARCR